MKQYTYTVGTNAYLKDVVYRDDGRGMKQDTVKTVYYDTNNPKICMLEDQLVLGAKYRLVRAIYAFSILGGVPLLSVLFMKIFGC